MKMNTKLRVKSEVGIGSLFWFTLPYVKEIVSDKQIHLRLKQISFKLLKDDSPCISSNRDSQDAVADEILATEVPKMIFRKMIYEECKNSVNPVVLIIDDAEMNRLVLRWMIEKHNINIEIFEGKNGVEAVELFRNHVRGRNIPCLILMDIEMPEMDGIEATQLIRRDCDKDLVCIVAATAFASEVERESCMKIGMNAFLTKPITSCQIKQSLALSHILH